MFMVQKVAAKIKISTVAYSKFAACPLITGSA